MGIDSAPPGGRDVTKASKIPYLLTRRLNASETAAAVDWQPFAVENDARRKAASPRRFG